MPLPNSPNSIRLKFRAVVQNPAMGRAPRGPARPGTVSSTLPPLPRLYFLAGVTRGAYFYGLYYFAFLECALPGVNQRPQFGQCRIHQYIGAEIHIWFFCTLIDLSISITSAISISHLTISIYLPFLPSQYYCNKQKLSKRWSAANNLLCFTCW